MTTIPNLLNFTLGGVTLARLGLFFIIILSTFIVRSLFIYIITKKMDKFLHKIVGTDYDHLIIKSIRNSIGYLIILEGFYLAIMSLQLKTEFDLNFYINSLHLLTISFILLYFIFKIIDVTSLYLSKHAKDGESALDEQLIQLLTKSLRILVIVIGILFILSNFGYNILSLLAGLGLGGLALALAAQTTVGNLFGSITIFSDKPFKYGDDIIIGDVEGTVEEVGFRSTRVRRLDNAIVVIPNSFFINQEVTNLSAIKKRRIKFDLKISHKSTFEQIKHLVEGIKDLIHNDDRFETGTYEVKFNEFGEYSFNIMILCFTKTINYSEYLSIKEELNFGIIKLLNILGIELAQNIIITGK